MWVKKARPSSSLETLSILKLLNFPNNFRNICGIEEYKYIQLHHEKSNFACFVSLSYLVDFVEQNGTRKTQAAPQFP